ncbi:AsnC family transcriptional regulator [Candidatus Woesearchaeota archaeon]|nr:AsnC family transcriptional regulator [Candidatus Woesearchaeota archaeon]
MGLDKKDTQLLAELDTNSRQTYQELGRKLRLSKDAVKYRMERLEKLGIIEGYYTEINTMQLGYTIYRLYFKLQNIDEKKKKEMIAWFVSRKETFYVVEIVGQWDIDILMWVKSNVMLEQFWRDFKMMYRKYVQNYLLSIYTRLQIFPRKYLGNKAETVYIKETADIVKIDYIDTEILRQLASDARLNFVDIALKLKTTAKIVAYRVRKLERQGIILKYRAKLNYTLLGRGYYKLEVNLNDITKLKSFYYFAFMHKDFTHINETLGSTDFEGDIEIESFEKLTEIISQLQAQFPGTVRDYFYFQIFKVYKINFFPE